MGKQRESYVYWCMFILVTKVHRNMWTDINRFSECLYISNPEKCGSFYIHLYLLLTKHESTYLWRKTISTLTSSLSLCRKSLRKLDTLSSVIWPQTTICLERGKIQLSSTKWDKTTSGMQLKRAVIKKSKHYFWQQYMSKLLQPQLTFTIAKCSFTSYL